MRHRVVFLPVLAAVLLGSGTIAPADARELPAHQSPQADVIAETLRSWQHAPRGAELPPAALAFDPDARPGGRITTEEARADVQRFFYLLEHGYCGYGYFSRIGDFDAALESVLQELSAATHWAPRDLPPLIGRHLDFVSDCHLKLDTFTFAGHQDFWFVPKLAVIEHDGEYRFRTAAGNRHAGAIVSINGRSPDGFFFPSLDRSGEAIYVLGRLSFQTPSPLEVVLATKGDTRTVTFELRRSTYKGHELFRRFDLGGIPVVRIRTFSDHHTEEIDAFLACADELRGEPCVIIDLRGNGGGNTRWPREWIRRFTGVRPQLSQALCEYVSRTTLIGLANYFAWLEAGPGKSIALRLQQEQKHLADELAMYEDSGSGPHWRQPYVPRLESIPNETTLIVITDRQVASAGEGLISFLHDQVEQVVLVGENTRGALTFGHLSAHRLPHSKLLAKLPVKLNVPLDLDVREARGYEPDIWAPAADALNRAVAAVRAGTIKAVRPLPARVAETAFIPEKPPRFSRSEKIHALRLALITVAAIAIGVANRRRHPYFFVAAAIAFCAIGIFGFRDIEAARVIALIAAAGYGVIACWKSLRPRAKSP